MTPDIELQLQVIVKSLKDNVAPAIDKDNQLAQEQMHLSLAALQFTIEHLPFVHAYLQKDLENNIQLAKKMMALPCCKPWESKLLAAVSIADEAINNPKKGFIELQQESRSLREVVCSIVSETADTDEALDVYALVLTDSAGNLEMGRAWNKSKGFEPNPDEVPELHTLFT